MAPLRWLVRLVILLVVVIIIAFAVLFFVVDGDKIRETIADRVEAETGMVLKFHGDTSLSFFPDIAVHAEEVGIYQPDGSTAVAGIESFDMAVSLMPLFSREVDIEEININGFFARYTVDTDGRSNFDTMIESLSPNEGVNAGLTSRERSEPSSSNGWQIESISLPPITIEQSVLEYLNRAEQQALSLAVNSMEIDEIDLSAGSFRVDTDALITQKNAEHTVSGSSHVSIRDMQQFLFESNDWQVSSTIHPLLDNDVHLSSPRVLWQQESEKLQIQDLSVMLDELSAEGEFFAQLGDNLSWDANLQTNTFALSTLRSLLPAGAQNYLGSQITVNNAALSGNNQRLQVSNIDARFDESDIAGSITLPFDGGVKQLDLQINQLDANSYVNANESTGNDVNNDSTNVSSASTQSQDLLPTEMLRALRLNGDIDIARLTYDNYQLEDVRCALAPGNSERNVIECNLSSSRYPLSARLAAFVGNQQPLIGADVEIAGMSLDDALAGTSAAGLLSGSLAGTVELNATGESVASWMDSLDGPFNFDIDQPVINGVNVNNLIVEAIGESRINQLSAILDMTGNELPRELSENTELVDTRLQGNVDSGVVRFESLNLATVNGDAISGGGSIRLSDLQTDLNFSVKLRALQRHEFLSDFEWPIACQGTLGEQSLSQLCGGAVGNLQTIVTKVVKRRARQEAENLAKSEIEKLTGVQLGEGNLEDSVKQELQNQLEKQRQNLQDQANDERQNLQNQIEEKLKEEVGNSLLKGLFGN